MKYCNQICQILQRKSQTKISENRKRDPRGAFHLRRIAGTVADKVGKSYFTLPKSLSGDAFSINCNSGNTGDTGFAG